MAPTEPAILTNFLLTPSQLPAIITPQEFTALFPRALQSSEQVRTLYRDLQAQRNEVVHTVAGNIELEAKKSKHLIRSVVRARRQADSHEYDPEFEIEKTLFGDASGVGGQKRHLQTALPELESAITELESEVNRLEEEETELRQALDQIVGSMSDLRYGRLANSQLPAQVLESLSDLQATCKQRG